MIEERCSNCGFNNKYPDDEFIDRNNTLCKNCGHTLSVCPDWRNNNGREKTNIRRTSR